MHTPGTYTAGHIHHRHTACPHRQLHLLFSPAGRGSPKASAQPQCWYRPSCRAGWDTLLPQHWGVNPIAVLPGGTQAHIHISLLTPQSLQQPARPPWWPQQLLLALGDTSSRSSSLLIHPLTSYSSLIFTSSHMVPRTPIPTPVLQHR